MKSRRRDCLICGRSSWHGKVCLEDPEKRSIEMRAGYRPDWCPIDDARYAREPTEKTDAAAAN